MAATTPGPKAVLTGLVRVATPLYESTANISRVSCSPLGTGNPGAPRRSRS